MSKKVGEPREVSEEYTVGDEVKITECEVSRDNIETVGTIAYFEESFISVIGEKYYSKGIVVKLPNETHIHYPSDWLHNISLQNRKTAQKGESLEPVKKDPVEESLQYDYVNPHHYQTFSVEVIDMMVAIYGSEKVADHCELCAFKYKLRVGSKPDQPIERDLEKAQWYLNKAKELRGGKK